MDLTYQENISKSIRISIKNEDGKECARASIFLITNDLHDQPYALIEDVFVQEEFRGQGFGKKIMQAVIQKADDLDCYKIIATSRNKREKVHEFYEKLGFINHGFEFRMNLN